MSVLRSAMETFDRLKVDYTTWIPAHSPTPDRTLTRADVQAAVGREIIPGRRGSVKRG
jgi:hypothetical protein